jgi:ankyrin repeat protein
MLGQKSTADRVRNSFKGQDSEYPLHASICQNELATLQHVLASPEAAYLLKSGDGCWGTPLHLSVYLDSIEVANILLQAGADVIAGSSEHELRLSPLALAAREGNERLLWIFWKHLHTRPFTNDIKELEMCLFQAAMNGQVPILRAMLGWWEWTAKTKNDVLLWSARSWKFYSAELLLSELSFDQQTLDEALGCTVAFKPLLSSKLIDYNGDDYLQQQFLIALLIHAGADPNGDTYGEPFIIIAARHIDLVGALKVLLEKGADPNVTNHEGKRALHFLALPTAMHQSGPPVRINETAIRLLLSHGATVHQGDTEAGATPLHAAALGSNLKVLQLCISSCSIEDKNQALSTKNRYGETLLHYAAAGGKCDIAEFLISQDIDVNGVSENGWTPSSLCVDTCKAGFSTE